MSLKGISVGERFDKSSWAKFGQMADGNAIESYDTD